MKALIAEIAACGFWIAALIVTPEDTLPWYIRLFLLSGWCLAWGIIFEIDSIRRKR
jgi:hypothetical protein